MTDESIFAEAIKLTDLSERLRFLDRACAGNPKLRGEVDQLLAAASMAGSFLDKVGAEITGAFTRSPEATGDFAPSGHAHSNNASGSDLGTFVAGRYRLVQVLGEGGMGTVYVAEQTEAVKRRVALKLIKGGMDSRTVLARFEAERQALAMMDHPNIARIYDGGVTDRGQPFFVMELVQGLPLTEFCDGHRLSVQSRLELMVAVCQAVQHAHQKGIIHRDLKPGNVLVTEVDGRPTPKVIDFGVAKATEQKLTDQSFSDVGQIVGTPAYMSPEQADPSMDIDTRTDVYALGVILYELLVGSPPINAKDFQRGAILEMLRMVREVEPPRPSTKLSTADALPNIAANRNIEPAKLSKLLQGELDWVVMKALEKDRTRRYDTAIGLAMDIQRYLADEVVAARPPSRGYRLRKFVKRNKGQVVAAALLLMTLVGGVVGTSIGLLEAIAARNVASAKAEDERKQRIRAEAAEADAKKEWARAEENATEALERLAQSDALSAFLRVDLLQQASGRSQLAQRFSPKQGLTVREALDRAASRVEAKFAGRPRLEASIRHTLGEAYIGLGEIDKALKHFQRALGLREEQLGPDHEDTLKTNDQIGHSLLQAGKPLEALAVFTRTHDALARTKGADHDHTLSARSNRAQALLDAGRNAEAIHLFEQLRDARLSAFGPDHRITLDEERSLASAYLVDRRFNEAVALFERTRDRFVNLYGPDNPDTLMTLNNLAGAYIQTERFDKAATLLRDLLERSSRVNGADHPETLMIRNNLAESLLNLGDVKSAMPEFAALRDLTGRKLGKEHPGSAATTCGLARCLAALGRLDEALEMHEKSYGVYLAAYGPDHTDTLASLNFLGGLHWQRKRFDEGAAAFEKLLAGARKLHGDTHEYTVSAALNLALNYQDGKRHAECARVLGEWLDRAHDIKTLDPDFLLAGVKAGAECFAAAGMREEAARCILYMAKDLKDRKPPKDVKYAGSLAGLSLRLFEVGGFGEAETLLRESLELREKFQPDVWSTFNARSMLGASLLAQRKYAEAEPLLLQGYEGMKQRETSMPAGAEIRIIETLDRLLSLAAAMEKQDDLKKWRAERAKYPLEELPVPKPAK